MQEAAPGGLSTAEVEDRRRRGLSNELPARVSRSVTEIVRANVLTRFNAILGALLAVIIVVGPFQDALFGFVLVANTLVGIVQELRAKRTLDRLAVLTAPRARVVRDGSVSLVPVGEVVLDDVLELEPGDQVVVDGVVLAAGRLEVDESLLTGEAEPVDKGPGDEVFSGSFVASGSGRYRATRVGADSYARALADEARRFALVRSELRNGIDQILRMVTWVLIPTAILLVTSQLTLDHGLEEALRASVAGVGSMVPEGLVLLTSVAFAVGVVRLGRQRVLVQELPAIEGLARVDVVCVDKTGTLTERDIDVATVEWLAANHDDAIGALAAADPHPNASLQALAGAFAAPAGWVVEDAVPFSSARKWSAASFNGHGTWVLGAPEVVLADAPRHADVRARAERLAEGGRRVVLLGRAIDGLDGEHLPIVEPVALIVLEERVRTSAAATLSYFADQGVTVKVISGDHPRTVGAIADRLGVTGAGTPVDGRRLPEDAVALADAVEAGAVFGRVTPHQKRAMVAALQSRGHVVAMTGDGVNDVLALKDADLGVAMGSGSSATRAVAQLVLLDDTFDALPSVVGEGRRVTANVERVANLFVTKTVYAMFLAIAVGVARVPFPFLPRHLTIVSSLTIGVPAFFLALAPNSQRYRPGFVPRVLRFAIPAGTVAAVATLSAYWLARQEDGVSLNEARTTAMMVLFTLGLWVLSILARPLTDARRWLLAAMGFAFVMVLAVPGLRTFFAIDPPPLIVWAAAVGVAAVAGGALELGWRGTHIVAQWWASRRTGGKE